MGSVTVAKARESIAEIMNRAIYNHERTVVTRHGKGVVAIVPIEDVRLIEHLEEKIDLCEMRAAEDEMKKHGTIPWDKVKEELGL